MKTFLAAVLVAGSVILPGCGESRCDVLAKQMAAIHEQMNATDPATNEGIAEYNRLVDKSNIIGAEAKDLGCDPMDFIG